MVAAKTCAVKGPGFRSLSVGLMSALGQKPTWHFEIAMSALPPKADIRIKPQKYHR